MDNLLWVSVDLEVYNDLLTAMNYKDLWQMRCKIQDTSPRLNAQVYCLLCLKMKLIYQLIAH